MDSLTQIALGAAVGIATMGRRTKPWKAAVVGAVVATFPDLDAFIDHGDPIRNMTFHRTESHAFFYLTLVAPFFAWIATLIFREKPLFKRWWLAIWLALITHPMLDYMTVYGTQLGLPFTDHPFALGSIFIIDLAYTMPLLIGAGVAIGRAHHRGLPWNKAGLLLSTLYLGWSALAQHQVTGIAEASLRERGLTVERLHVAPTAFNTLLWRVLAITPDGYAEGYYSFFDADRHVDVTIRPQRKDLLVPLAEDWSAQRIVWFSHGFFKLSQQGDKILITDLRMGQEPYYTFNFEVATREGDSFIPTAPRLVNQRPPLDLGMQWLWRRLKGEKINPPGID